MLRPVLAALLSVRSTQLSDDEKRLLARHNPLGITLFNRNLKNKEQTRQLIQSIKETIGRDDVIIAADTEGGRVNRLQTAGYGLYASERVLGKINDDETVAVHARLIAADMHDAGVNMNFAPVLDLEYPGKTTSALQGRCFGNDEKQTAHLGKILCQTYIDCGICPCIKHMPGHGRAENDPHLELPVIRTLLKDLEKDFYPFIKNADCPAGMTGHILLPEIDAVNPITLSFKGIREIIRGRIGFNGLLFSDALDMHALKGSITERAEAAWNAGCDVVCYCFGESQEMEALCRNGCYMNDKALERFENAKKVFNNGKSLINLDNDRKKYYSLINQITDECVNYDATEVLHQMQKGEK